MGGQVILFLVCLTDRDVEAGSRRLEVRAKNSTHFGYTSSGSGEC